MGVGCADSDNPANYSAWWEAAQQAEQDYGYFGPLWTYASSLCSDWPGVQNDRYNGPFTQWTANPVLVIGNYFDPATRYQGAQTVADLLPNSRLLSLNGWGHCSLFLSQCVDQAVADYLVNGTLPPEGLVCNQDLTPFADFGLSAQVGNETLIRSFMILQLVPEAVRRGLPQGE